MKYYILAKIVGPYLPKKFTIGNIKIEESFFDEFPDYPVLPIRDISSENHLIKKGVNYRIGFTREKINLRSFSSNYLLTVPIKEKDPRRAKKEAIIRIEQIIEALNIASFSKDRIRDGTILEKRANDFYHYEFLGIYMKQCGTLYRIKLPLLASGVNFFPEDMEKEIKDEAKNILKCNDPIFIKLSKYLKRAKEFSYEHFSEIEVFLNSIKCMELICNKFCPKGTKKLRKNSKKTKMTFKERLKKTVKLLNIDKKYQLNAEKAWDSRGKADFAHATEHDRLFPSIWPHEVNETAYYFVLKYIQYLEKNNPNCIWSDRVLKEDDWWKIYS